VYNQFGNLIETTSISNRLKDVGGTSSNIKWVGGDSIMRYKSGFKSVRTTQDFGFVDQLIKLPTFTEIDDNVTNNMYPWEWAYNGNNQTSFAGKVRKSGDYLLIHPKAQRQTDIFYVGQKFEIIKLPNPDEDKKQYEFRAEVVLNDPVEVVGTFVCKLIVKNSNGDTAYMKNDGSEIPFTDTDTTMTVTGQGRATISVKFDFPTHYMDSSNDKPFQYDEILECDLRIYQDTTQVVKVKSVVMNAALVATAKEKIESRYSAVYNETTSDIYEKNMELGDVPDIFGAKLIYKNALFYYYRNSWRITRDWYDPDDTVKRALPILKWMRELWLREYSRQLHVILGRIRGDVSLDNYIKDITYGNRLYVITGGKMSIKYATIDAEFVECGIDDSALKSQGVGLVDSRLSTTQASGSAAYKPVPAAQPDLSDFLNEQEINSIVNNSIEGKQGSFSGSDLSGRQVTIYHNLGYEAAFLILIQDGKMLSPANYTVDTEGSTDHVVLSLFMPYTASTEFKYRFL
jgi:hypothetical protein